MVKTPLFPQYNKVKLLMKILEGKPVSRFNSMISAIMDLTGTPQDPVDWSNPDKWIPEWLKGEDAALAKTIWEESGKILNPRHSRGPKFLIDNYELLHVRDGNFHKSQTGRDFLSADLNDTTRQIDMEEGLIFLLYRLSFHGSGKRGTFFEEWKEYLSKNSNYKTTNVVNDSLTRRLKNLVFRNLVAKSGNSYSITDQGTAYLQEFDDYESFSGLSEEIDISHEIEKFNKKQKEELLAELSQMNPFQFEHTIKELLLAMGYDDVEVTSERNDKGVDVVGTIQKGISSVKEVIQVKRFSANIIRPVLDALRGSLHRFDAFQGTIITTSDYSKGTKEAAFERGAAPITLINGAQLLDLLIDNEIGVKKKKAEFFTVDKEYFNPDQEEIIEDANEE